MKLGLFGDVHGNLVALETVLMELWEKDVDALACTGDVVGVLGWPEECANLIKREVDYVVYGNHDAYVRSDYAFVPEWPSQKQEHRVVTQDMTAESMEWLNSLPETVKVTEDVTLCHANPYSDNPTGFPADEYVDKKDWTEFGTQLNGEMVLLGHTHEAGKLDLSKFDGLDGYICNPGSVGCPYYKDARYAVVDTETKEMTLHRAYYDSSKVKKRLDQLGVKPANKVNEAGFL